ncbi:MAG TPA: hypothetical protein VI216_04765, partial [Candidatus Acidoferrales bacterium]
PMVPRILAMAAWLVLLASSSAWSCTCSQASPGQCPGLQQADSIFLGTVTTIQEMPNAPAAPRPSSQDQETNSAENPSVNASGAPVDTIAARLTRYHFHIDEQFAGAESATASEIDIFSGGSDADCGYRFKANGQYLVFAHRGKDGRLLATICDGTRSASDARALLPQLRAMRDGRRVASVFGVLRRADPPFLTATNDPDDPLPNVSVKIRSRDDRFETSTDADGVYRFYDVHAGEYTLTTDLPAGTGLTQKSLGSLQPFTIPDGACFEYDVDALPTGSIHGSVLGPDGKPLDLASLELYRAGNYSSSRPGLWAFQGAEGGFDYDHIGPGDYILVFNRANRMNPNAPFKRAFYPGVADLSEAQPIHLDDGQNLSRIDIHVSDRYAARRLRIQLKWIGAKPSGNVTVAVKADQGENPAADIIGDDLYEVTLLESASYEISAWEDLDPARAPTHRRRKADCPPPARVNATSVSVLGSDANVKKVTLTFARPGCGETQQQ